MKTVDWKRYARYYDQLLHLEPYQKMQKEVRAALPLGCTTLLDAGCGTGNLLALLLATGHPSGMKPYGIDMSEHMLERAREKLGQSATLAVTDLTKPLPFTNGFFEVVTCINTLYTLPDPKDVLREFARILKRKGTLVIVTPKQGHNNGLILKAHCASQKPDAYWMDIHRDLEHERILVQEAFASDDISVDAMLNVFAINRRISENQNGVLTFFERGELFDLIQYAGFTQLYHTYTYADQAHMIVARAL